MLNRILIPIVLLGGCTTIAYPQHSTSKGIQELQAALNKSTPDTFRVNLLLQAANYYTGKIPASVAAQDSAAVLATEAETLSNHLKFTPGAERSCIALAKACIAAREIKLGQGEDEQTGLIKLHSIENKLVAMGSAKGSNKAGEIYSALAGIYNWIPPNFSEKRRLYQLAVEAFQKGGDKKQESETWYYLGFSHNVTGNLPGAQECYLQSISTGKIAGRKDLQEAYGALGNTYNFQGDYKLALQYELEGMKIAEAEKDTSQTPGIINLYLGLTYEAMQDEDEKALKHYSSAMAVFEKFITTNLSDFGNASSNTAKMIMNKDPAAALVFIKNILQRYPQLVSDPSYDGFLMRLMQCHMHLKQYNKGQPYCDRLLSIAAKSPPIVQRILYTSTIQFLVFSKQYHKARKYLPLLQQIVQESNEMTYMKEAELYWHQVDSAQGKYQSALQHFMRYKAITDSLFNETKAKEIAQLNIQYETEKKDRDIQLKEKSITLLTKEKLLQQATISKAAITRNIIIGGAVMLLLLLALLYNRYQLKQKANRDINDKNLALQQMVNEKEWLLKEVHHRVKNNLQTVVSLLESQSAYLHSDALLAIQDSQNRVHAMSLVHQKLYQAENVTSINMAVYLPELVNYLRDGFNAGHIHFKLQVAPVELDVSQAIPVGLIVNEAITNAIKYAFPGERNGNRITIFMEQLEDKKVELTVSDNGIGLPEAFDMNRNGGLGLRLMKGLTEDINGQFTVKAENETIISVSFTPNILLHKATGVVDTKLVSHPV